MTFINTVDKIAIFGAHVRKQRTAAAAELGLVGAEADHYIATGDLPDRLLLPEPGPCPAANDAIWYGIAPNPIDDADDRVERLGDGRPVVLSHEALLWRMANTIDGEIVP